MSRPEGIENPLVIASLTAGLAGVTIIIIIILSIWILKRAGPSPNSIADPANAAKNNNTRSYETTNGNGNHVKLEIMDGDENASLQMEDDGEEDSNQSTSSMSLHLNEEFHQQNLTIVVSIPRETEGNLK